MGLLVESVFVVVVVLVLVFSWLELALVLIVAPWLSRALSVVESVAVGGVLLVSSLGLVVGAVAMEGVGTSAVALLLLAAFVVGGGCRGHCGSQRVVVVVTSNCGRVSVTGGAALLVV